MLSEILINLFERELKNLKAEIEKYPSDESLWVTAGEVTNSAGNLALHLTGNLQHFIGAVLGGSGYVRDRDAEFSSRNVSRPEIYESIDKTMSVVTSTLSGYSDDQFAQVYPLEVFGEPMTTGYFLIHLATHFSYHLGQINYHRRLLASS